MNLMPLKTPRKPERLSALTVGILWFLSISVVQIFVFSVSLLSKSLFMTVVQYYIYYPIGYVFDMTDHAHFGMIVYFPGSLTYSAIIAIIVALRRRACKGDNVA
jgi:hypothetical protein